MPTPQCFKSAKMLLKAQDTFKVGPGQLKAPGRINDPSFTSEPSLTTEH